jgi:uncharacterized membrane protein YkoI
MKRKTIALIAAGLAVTGAGGAGLAYAAASEPGEQAEGREGPGGEDDQQEARVLAGARISLAQAVQAAEARTGMKASEAGIDDESGQPLFEVTVGQGQQEQTVLVDTQTGQVAQVRADTEEGEQDDD